MDTGPEGRSALSAAASPSSPSTRQRHGERSAATASVVFLGVDAQFSGDSIPVKVFVDNVCGGVATGSVLGLCCGSCLALAQTLLRMVFPRGVGGNLGTGHVGLAYIRRGDVCARTMLVPRCGFCLVLTHSLLEIVFPLGFLWTCCAAVSLQVPCLPCVVAPAWLWRKVCCAWCSHGDFCGFSVRGAGDFGPPGHPRGGVAPRVSGNA